MTSRLIASLAAELTPLMEFVESTPYGQGAAAGPDVCDFVFGNPHEMPLPGIVEALGRHLEPKDKDWFAYKRNEPEAVEPAARALRASHGLDFQPEDVFMTQGTFGALTVTLRALLDPGDEVVFLSPPWFFYETMVKLVGATPVRVVLNEPDFAPNADALEAAVSERTRALIVNTPHNPTGRILTADELAPLADAAARVGAVILSDESYRRIVFDGRSFTSPASVYDDTIVLYTYGKTLLSPGERLGYAALSPRMKGRDELREAMVFAQMLGGWLFPNATLQRALADLEELTIDVEAIQRRRDRMASALQEMGYELMVPEATFYMMVRSPDPDDVAFTKRLAEHDVYVGPGTIFEMPGWFRISLTANDDMVERSLPGFAAARG